MVCLVHPCTIHTNRTPPEPFAARYSQDPYSGEIAYADQALGVFLDRLRSGNALDRTLVVITSDHGESLGEHGERTHGLFAYEATLRVPLIVWARETIKPAVSAEPARLVDLAPTMLDLVGIPAGAFDGRSLRPRAANEPPLQDSGSYFGP
jgi:arylsulfatase A-like enzyme